MCYPITCTFRAKQAHPVTKHPPKTLPQLAGKENDHYKRLPQAATHFIIGKKRTRCGDCKGCISSDCGMCKFCEDKPKFGGRGTLKQCCVKRRCIRIDQKGNNFYFIFP